ncbi:MAG: GGDEF domain-containing protein [Alphaproteobacteria bacterium]|nr:GGDEF domain-containing protein [Alphaproteobacteria bacterium]MDE1987130.1 GGDEF domain-containing protein [Alphaproteobacteria bacterium]MDE2162898.1 GGDEF domain-containing protein [Alphaproteobacteria bacterium]MDE2500326.1 GGDEF domain-containing protein [Alphaproteobacteria bacterium]
MKVDRTGSVRGARAVGVAAYAKQAQAVAVAEGPAPVGATASVLGIPESEFTPRVRDAIMTLMGEVDNLRRELQQTRERLGEVERAADQDQLLPLLNRRAFVRELMRYIAFTGRYGTPTTLLYFDLDGFKAVNDTFGHAGGDAVLSHFAETLLGHVRDSDVVGRLGGDEFGVLLSHANQEQGARKADQLAEKLRAQPPIWNGKPIPTNFSYGAFELKPGDTADLAMARADEAMYAHKRTVR